MNVAVKDAHQLTRASQSANILLALKLNIPSNWKKRCSNLIFIQDKVHVAFVKPIGGFVKIVFGKG